jgi:hypothetical protein
MHSLQVQTLTGVNSRALRLSARDGEKIRQIRRFENRMVNWPGFVANTHNILVVRFRYGLSFGSWNLQL